MSYLLEFNGLDVDFMNGIRPVNVINNLSFGVARGEVLGVVGESGSGKSVTSLAAMRLLPEASARVRGKIIFDEQDLLALDKKAMQKIRGKRLAMVFQEPMTSLNPIHSCGRQIMEVMLLHTDLGKKEARAKALDLLQTCGVPDAARRLDEYPHQLSGGLRQRIMIAMALACDPDLLIADEPTTALDVTIQAQILKLLKDIRRQREMAIMMITHDLGIVFDFCDRVIVMYCGEIVESALVDQLFAQPLHPYTSGLIDALPRLDDSDRRLVAIEGMVPDAGQMPTGCFFHPRCKKVMPRCRIEHPQLGPVKDRQVRCFLYEEEV